MSDNKQPLVSIIVPVYNTEKYLNQCIDSLINQTYKNIEIILVNDGSTDDSGKICDEYKAKDKRVKVYHIQNKGVSNARNIGISKAAGQFIMFLDSDDWIEPETCEVALSKALETDSDIVFWSWIKESANDSFKETYLEENSKILINNEVNKLRIRCIGLLDDELKNPVKTDAFNTPWAKLYKRDLLINSGVEFIERKKVGMEDVLFNIQLFQYVNKVTYIAKYFNHYVLENPTSLTKIDTDVLFEKFKTLFNNIENIGHKNLRFEEALNNRICTSLINIMLSITNPRIYDSFNYRLKSTRVLLDDDIYSIALKKFNTKYLPIHWKLFFTLAKLKQAFLLLLLTYLIRFIK